MNITFIIISYNSHAIISKCLASIIESRDYESIIVDNASHDRSAEILENKFPAAKVIKLEQNVGYGRAANIALEKTRTPYAFLLNPDLHATPEDVRMLLHHAQSFADDNVAIIAPAVTKDNFTGDAPDYVSWISGSAMLINIDNIKPIGFFDEKLFLYFEETDLCHRIIRSNHKIILCRDIYMKHMKNQSSTSTPETDYMKNWHFGWSRAYFLKKHQLNSNKNNIQRIKWIYLSKSILATSKCKRQKYKARAAGIMAFIRGQEAFQQNGQPQALPSYMEGSSLHLQNRLRIDRELSPA